MPKIKLSEQAYKRTLPGIMHVIRFVDDAGRPVGDQIVDDSVAVGNSMIAVDVNDPLTTYDFTGATGIELLEQIVDDGKRCKEPDTIAIAKERCRDSLMRLDPAVKRFLNPQTYPVGLEPGLDKLRHDLARTERRAASKTR